MSSSSHVLYSSLRLALPFLVIGAASVAPCRAAGGRGAAGVVRACYAEHFLHDMAFTEKSVRRKEAWLSPELFAGCLAYLARPASPDEAPAINGDPFTDSQEYPQSFRIGRVATGDAATRVPITLVWPHSDRRVVAVVSIIDGAWRITDLEYPDGGTLSGMLAAD